MNKTNENSPKNLGCKTIFASADLSSFKKASDAEVKAVLSNSNFKIALKTNDSTTKE